MVRGNPINMTNALGRLLRAARERKGYTLRDIERISEGEITNAYVCQIELGEGRVELPKVHKLRLLSRILDVDYVTLLIAAGYLTTKDIERAGWELGR